MKICKVVTLCMLLGFVGNAQETKVQKPEQILSITGAVRCSSCDLKKEKGALSQCSIYGCQFSFKTAIVKDERGKRIKKFEGKTYHILLNDQSKKLTQKEHKGKRFVITGKIYESENVIEIKTFSSESTQ